MQRSIFPDKMQQNIFMDNIQRDNKTTRQLDNETTTITRQWFNQLQQIGLTTMHVYIFTVLNLKGIICFLVR